MNTPSPKKGSFIGLSLAKLSLARQAITSHPVARQPHTGMPLKGKNKVEGLDAPSSQAQALPKKDYSSRSPSDSLTAFPIASPCDSPSESPCELPSELLCCSPLFPQQGLLIIGTGTDIGKTLVTAALLRALQANGTMAHGLKVIQTGCLQDSNGQLLAPDVQRYTEACPEGNHRVLWCFKPACSPHLAARQAKTSLFAIQVAQSIEQEKNALPPDAFMCVEGSGGVMVPINEQETFLEVFGLLGLPALMVCPNELGCVNHALLTAHALRAKSIPLLGFVLTSPQKPKDPKPTNIKAKNSRLEVSKPEAEKPETSSPKTSTPDTRKPETRASDTKTPMDTSLTDTNHAIQKDNRAILETMLNAPCLGEIPWLSSFASSKGRASNQDWDKAALALAPVVQALKKSSQGKSSSSVCNAPNT